MKLSKVRKRDDARSRALQTHRISQISYVTTPLNIEYTDLAICDKASRKSHLAVA